MSEVKPSVVLKYCRKINRGVSEEFCSVKCGAYFDKKEDKYVKCFWNFSRLPMFIQSGKNDKEVLL